MAITIPYSFRTDKTGIHKIELFRQGASNPVSVYSSNISVSNIAILQTGTISLESLNADNYKLYIYKLLDDGSNECLASSNTTLLTCSGDPLNCTKPTFDVEVTSSTCNNGLQNSDAKVVIKNVVDGLKVRYCIGQVWNCSQDYNLAKDITDKSLFTVFSDVAVTTAAQNEYYVIRVYKDPVCFLDKVVKLTIPSCSTDFCNFEEIYNGQKVDKRYYFKYSGSQPLDVAMRFEPTKPSLFKVLRNSVPVFLTECAGIDNTGCASCGQGGTICGKILLQAQDTLEVQVDSSCASTDIAAWTLRTACTSIPECATFNRFGENNICGITLPANGLKFTCNPTTNKVDLEVSGYYGGISNQYQFGYDITGAWQTANDVVWENTNKRISLEKSTSVIVWVRDKNNTDCVTAINAFTPSCINVNPILKQSTIKQFFTQSGNTIQVDADNIIESSNYEANYTYTDENYNRGGSFNKTTKKLTLPTVDKAGTIEITLKDTNTGAISNRAYFNVLNEQLLFKGDIITNGCVSGDTATYLTMSYNKIDSLLPYIVEIRDAFTSALLITQEVSDPLNIKIKHTFTDRPVTIQAYSKGNKLKGSQLTEFTLTQTVCGGTTSPTCCIESLVYGANVIGTNTQLDSIGIYYKGNCQHGYRFFIESETQRGTYELYTTVNSAATVVSNSPYSAYNYRPIQAMASRVWRNKNYKVKFEFFNGSTIIDTAEFIVDLAAGTPLNTPITKFNCGSTGGGSSCQLVDKEDYGDFNPGDNNLLDLQSRFYAGKGWYMVTAVRNSSTDLHFVRGLNILDNSSKITISKTPVRSCFAQTTTDYGGQVVPPELVNNPPSGYRQGVTSDGAVYFEIGTTQAPYPCNDENCQAYTGTIPAQTGGSNYYPKLIYERRKPSLGVGAGANAPFISRDEAIALIAQRVASGNDAVNSNGFLANFDFVTTIKNSVYTQFYTIGDYLLNNNNPPYSLGVAQCGYFVAPIPNGGTVYDLDNRFYIIAVNNCGKIVNIETHIVSVNGNEGGTVVTGDLATVAGAQPTYNGTIDAAKYYTNNKDILDVEVASYVNGKLKFRNKANPYVGDGRVIKILCNSLMPPLSKAEWESREWTPQGGPYLFQMYFADPNDAQFERGQYQGAYANVPIS